MDKKNSAEQVEKWKTHINCSQRFPQQLHPISIANFSNFEYIINCVLPEMKLMERMNAQKTSAYG